MDDLQYLISYDKDAFDIYTVLNLVINGWPSILFFNGFISIRNT